MQARQAPNAFWPLVQRVPQQLSIALADALQVLKEILDDSFSNKIGMVSYSLSAGIFLLIDGSISDKFVFSFKLPG